ncbi:MAG: hypothetical protein UDQ48_04155, partial [Dialister sp.]|uniref:hypothetical protein n=2 Tax=Dialister TaxID=39948 RepID=UPI002E77C213
GATAAPPLKVVVAASPQFLKSALRDCLPALIVILTPGEDDKREAGLASPQSPINSARLNSVHPVSIFYHLSSFPQYKTAVRRDALRFCIGEKL